MGGAVLTDDLTRCEGCDRHIGPTEEYYPGMECSLCAQCAPTWAEVLTATQDHAVTAANAVEIRFLRWLGRTWLDAPDRPARAIARRLIADHLTQMTAEATP